MNLKFSFEKIALADTNVLDINCNPVLRSKYGTAMLEHVSGTAVQADSSSLETTIDSDCASITSANPKVVLQVTQDIPVQVKGGADSVFTISIIPDR